MAENDKKSTTSRKRLDFGVVRKKFARKPAVTQSKAPSKPLTVNRGRFIDFAPSRARTPLEGTGRISGDSAPVSHSSTSGTRSISTGPTSVIASSVKVSHNSIESSSTSVEVSQNGAPRRVVSRGLRMDFVRRPASAGSSTPVRPNSARQAYISPDATVADVLGDTPDEPLMSDNDLAAALAGFADAGISEDRPAGRSSDRANRSARRSTGETDRAFADADIANDASATSDFEAELDAFDELSDDIFNGQSVGDDIDRIEAEIEAEANDFVKAPKPLFEDPLVQISKVREEEEQQHQAAEHARMKEEAREKAKETAKRAPYAALYTSANGHSPFLTSVTVEKRPLSSATSATSVSDSRQKPGLFSKNSDRSSRDSDRYPKNTGRLSKNSNRSVKKSDRSISDSYTSQMKKQLEADAKAIHRETMMLAAPDTKPHNTALIIGIILTILLGAGVGAVVYLAFFQ